MPKRKNEPRGEAHFNLMPAKDHCRPGETFSKLNEEQISVFHLRNECTKRSITYGLNPMDMSFEPIKPLIRLTDAFILR